jgi:hypothetical protein
MKKVIIILSLIGFIIFGAIFSSTFIAKKQIEMAATAFISQQVEVEVRKHLSGIMKISDKASQLKFIKNKYSEEINRLNYYLSSDLPKIVGKVVSDIYKGEIEEETIQNLIREYMGERISSLDYAISNIVKLIIGKYHDILNQLINDIRIFSGCNAFLFLMALLIALSKRITSRQAMLSTLLLLIATIASTTIYIFGQNWFYTIVFNKYVGFSYLIYVGLIFLFQCDLIFNKARVTDGIINFIGGLVAPP